MNAFITLFACVASALAAPQFGGVYHPRVHGVAGYPYAAAGVPYAAPYNPSSAFAAQDEFGNTQYGYSNLNSQKHEVGNTYTGVQGSYSYVDANGIVQTTNYIADGLGFRVQATNLPVAPVAPEVTPLVAPVHVYELPVAPVHEYVLPVAPVYDGVAPLPVQDTPEVAAAKAAHLALLAGEAPAAVEAEAPAAVEAEAPAAVEAEAPAAVEVEAPAAVEVEAPVEEEAPAAVEPVVEEEAPAAVEPVVEAEEAEAVVERRRRQTPANTEVLEAAAPLAPLAALPAVAPLGYAYPAGLAYGAGAVAHPHVLPVAGALGAYPGAYSGAYSGAYPGAYPGAYAYPGVGAYPYAAPEVVRSAPATADAELHTVKLNPGHATAYRVY